MKVRQSSYTSLSLPTYTDHEVQLFSMSSILFSIYSDDVIGFYILVPLTYMYNYQNLANQ